MAELVASTRAQESQRAVGESARHSGSGLLGKEAMAREGESDVVHATCIATVEASSATGRRGHEGVNERV